MWLFFSLLLPKLLFTLLLLLSLPSFHTFCSIYFLYHILSLFRSFLCLYFSIFPSYCLSLSIFFSLHLFLHFLLLSYYLLHIPFRSLHSISLTTITIIPSCLIVFFLFYKLKPCWQTKPPFNRSVCLDSDSYRKPS